MFRLIGFQCVITKPSAQSAFHLSASLSPSTMRKWCESLTMQKARVMNLIYPNRTKDSKQRWRTRRGDGCLQGMTVHQTGARDNASLVAGYFLKDKFYSHNAPSKGDSDYWIRHTPEGREKWNGIRFYPLRSGSYSELGRNQGGMTKESGPEYHIRWCQKNKQNSWLDFYNSSTFIVMTD